MRLLLTMCPGPHAKLAEQAECYDEIAEQSSSRPRTHHSDEVEKLRQQALDALLQEAQSGKLLEVLHQSSAQPADELDQLREQAARRCCRERKLANCWKYLTKT